MTGLLIYKNNSILKKWYNIFLQKNMIESKEACQHWLALNQLQIPNQQDENWKYIPLESFFSNDFIYSNININNLSINFEKLGIPLNSCKLIFINGRYISSLNSLEKNEWIISIKKKKLHHYYLLFNQNFFYI